MNDKIHRNQSTLHSLKRENRIKAKTLDTYFNYVIKMPDQGDPSKYVKCNHCFKFFANLDFLRKHYAKRHPNENFDMEFPDGASSKPGQNE